MRKFFIIIITFFTIIACNSRIEKVVVSESFHIDPAAKDSFYAAVKRIDTSEMIMPMIVGGLNAILFPKIMGDTLDLTGERGFEMPCECVFKNDTLTILSAIGYSGAFGYLAQVSEKAAESFYMQAGDSSKWEINGKIFEYEIKLKSIKPLVTISKKWPLKHNEIIYGFFDVSTPIFYELKGNEKTKQQHIVKIYFSCLVAPESYINIDFPKTNTALVKK